MSKSTRLSSSATAAPVMGNGQTTVSRWQAVCIRISLKRRAQSTASLAALPQGLRATLEQAALDAARHQRAMGPVEDSTAMAALAERGMTIRDIDALAFRQSAEHLWRREARALGVEPWLEAIRA